MYMNFSFVAAASENIELAETKAASLSKPMETPKVFLLHVKFCTVCVETPYISLKQHQNCALSDELLKAQDCAV